MDLIFNRYFYYILGLGIFICFSLFEIVYKQKRVVQSIRRKSYVSNGLLLCFNNCLLFLISTLSLYSIFYQYSTHFLENINIAWLRWGISFLLYDFLIYIWHWLNHRLKFLWFFHRCHHSDTDLNTSTGFRFHIGELLGSIVYKSLTIIIFGFEIEFVIFFEFVTLYAALFHHSNISVPFEKYLNRIFVMPIHHVTHHSVVPQEHHSNFGVIFSFWDVLFKTHNQSQPIKFGLHDVKQQNWYEVIWFGLSKINRIIFVISLFGILYFLSRWYY